MGKEAYGLVAFYMTTQALFQLLDLGMSSTVVKEVSTFRGNQSSSLKLRRLLRVIETIFWSISALIAITMIIASDYISSEWLSYENLNKGDVQSSIILIAIVSSLRWTVAFYKGVLIGYEKIILLSGFNAAFATLRFVVVIPILAYVGSSPIIFFMAQGVVALLEIIFVVNRSYALLPTHSVSIVSIGFLTEIKSIYKFSLSVSLISILWVMRGQYDKVMLSNWLSLSDYGLFMIAVLLASGIMYFNTGLYNVLLPRFNLLYTERKTEEMKELYKKYSQLILIIAAPIAFTLFFKADEVLNIWTGNKLPESVGKTLSYFSLGNLFVPLLSFPYILQYAFSNLKIAIAGNFLVLICAPFGLYFLFEKYGMQGAAINWFVLVLLQFLISSYFVHKKFFPNFHWKWLLNDIFTPLAGCLFVAIPMSIVDISGYNFIYQFLLISMFYVGCLLGVVLCSSYYRNYLINVLKDKRLS